MHPDFSSLDWHQFERFGGALLASEGYRNVQQFARPGERNGGIDWVFETAGGKRGIAQVKHLRSGRPLPVSQIRSIIIDLQNGLGALDADYAYLIVSTDLTPSAKELLLQSGIPITVWDRATLADLISKHEPVRHSLTQLLDTQNDIDRILQGLIQPEPPLDEYAEELIKRLDHVPKGKDGWRDFEDVCLDILNYTFVPPLRFPHIQSLTDDGLDRRDAIYPIGTGNTFWESIKHEYHSRMVVAEFKNFTDPIGQREVESLQQYLLPKAKRAFGILCSRHSPSDSAIKARRRAWMIAENIILFLSDDDLKELIRIRSDDGEPAEVLERQIDDFFITLAP